MMGMSQSNPLSGDTEVLWGRDIYCENSLVLEQKYEDPGPNCGGGDNVWSDLYVYGTETNNLGLGI